MLFFNEVYQCDSVHQHNSKKIYPKLKLSFLIWIPCLQRISGTFKDSSVIQRLLGFDFIH